MTNSLSRRQFLDSEKGMLLRKELLSMVKSPRYNTRPIYSTYASDENQFVEKHMDYMSKFPSMDHMQYVLNLKLMTKVRE